MAPTPTTAKTLTYCLDESTEKFSDKGMLTLVIVFIPLNL
jgi:hypothetical protein